MSEFIALAKALKAADWPDVLIGNKALIQSTIEHLCECDAKLEDAADNQRLIDAIADKIGIPKDEELSLAHITAALRVNAA